MPQLTSRRVYIPDGHAGTAATVRQMQILAKSGEGAASPYVHQLAQGIVHHLPERNQEAEARALAQWLKQYARFSNEDGEVLKSPMVTLGWDGWQFNPVHAGGDCDCLSTTLSALLWTLGIRNRFMVVATQANRPDTLNHVLVIAHDKRTGKWIALDPSKGDCQPPQIFRAEVYTENGHREEAPSLGCPGEPSCNCRAQSLGEYSDETSLSGIADVFGSIAGGIGTTFGKVGHFLNTNAGQNLFQDVLGPLASGVATHIAYGSNARLDSVTASSGSPFTPQAPGQVAVGAGNILSSTPQWLPWLLGAGALLLLLNGGGRR